VSGNFIRSIWSSGDLCHYCMHEVLCQALPTQECASVQPLVFGILLFTTSSWICPRGPSSLLSRLISHLYLFSAANTDTSGFHPNGCRSLPLAAKSWMSVSSGTAPHPSRSVAWTWGHPTSNKRIFTCALEDNSHS
jgi:hypothetical protein